LDANDELTLTAFLFLQDRIEEGLASFDKIDPTQVASRVIYDYLHAVVLFHRGNPEDAKTIASQSLASLPSGIWRDRFQMVIDQAGEIAALQAPAAAASTELEVIAPRLDLTLTDKGKLALRHQSLEKTTLRLFSVDLEMLFSNDPFLLGDSDHSGEPVIRPNTELEVTFEAHRSETCCRAICSFPPIPDPTESLKSSILVKWRSSSCPRAARCKYSPRRLRGRCRPAMSKFTQR
jgi:hypothetical protein